MSQLDKKLLSMKEHPHKDWKIKDLKILADRYGLRYRHNGTSHVIFTTYDGLHSLSVPAYKPIKPIYIKKFVAVITMITQGEAS